MSNALLYPVGPSRAFTVPLGADLDTCKARPGYSLADGGPALTSNASHETSDRRRTLPTRVKWEANGDIVLRYYLGTSAEGTGVGTAEYYDHTITALAGTVLDYSPDVIVAIGTTAAFSLAWPRR